MAKRLKDVDSRIARGSRLVSFSFDIRAPSGSFADRVARGAADVASLRGLRGRHRGVGSVTARLRLDLENRQLPVLPENFFSASALADHPYSIKEKNQKRCQFEVVERQDAKGNVRQSRVWLPYRNENGTLVFDPRCVSYKPGFPCPFKNTVEVIVDGDGSNGARIERLKAKQASGKKVTKACKSQLVYLQGKPYLRLCTHVDQKGPLVSVDSFDSLTEASLRLCNYTRKDGRLVAQGPRFDSPLIANAAIGGLRVH